MTNKLQLALPGEISSLTAIQQFVDSACEAAGIDNETSYDIKLAVDEACMNVIQHGYKGKDPGSVIVSFQYGVRQVVIHITDFGHPFEPSEPPQPDHEKVLAGTSGGYGLFFMYKIMDSITYETTETSNTLTLIKYLTDEKG